MSISQLLNRLGMNQVTAKIDVNEDFEFEQNSLITTSDSYHLDGEIKRWNVLDPFISDDQLFQMKIKNLNNGIDLIDIRGFLPNQVGQILSDSRITLSNSVLVLVI